MTDVLEVDAATPDPTAIQRAAECLRRGGLVAFPTETVYGLGVNALDRDALRRLFAAKERPSTDPLIVHVPSLVDVEPLVVELPRAARDLAARYWPGPLTLIMRRSARVPDEVTAGLETIAVRIPAHAVARALIAAAGLPIAAPSANRFSRPSPTRALHVLEDLRGRIDLVIDGGPTPIGVESTVLDLAGATPTILRPGAVTADMLREVLPHLHAAPAVISHETGPLRSPGLLAKHYSPRATLRLYEGDGPAVLARIADDAEDAIRQGKKVGLLIGVDDAAPNAVALTDTRRLPGDDPKATAAGLYAALRDLDRRGVDLILVRGIPAAEGLGRAIQDRLRRAAAGNVVRCRDTPSGT